MPTPAQPSNKSKRAPVPWFTLVANLLAVGAWFVPGAFAALVYDRNKILGGQLWRLVTGHWVHFSASHLFWNLAVLLPAGIWLEGCNPVALRRTLLLSPLAISLVLLAVVPSLTIYAGISGLAAGVLVALAIDRLCAQPSARLWWLAALALFAVKIIVEAQSTRPINPELTTQNIQSVPLAHLVGAAVGAGVVWVIRRRTKPLKPTMTAHGH
jgi:rhomboid family GlyGly-CTERM serine protease